MKCKYKKYKIAMENNEPNQQLNPGEQEGATLLARAKANSKLIVALSIFICAVIIGILVWFFVAQSGSRKADEAIARADMAANDSVALVLYKEAASHSYKSGNRAKIEVGIRLYQEGKYQEALEYLKDASADDHIVAAGVQTLTGDCYVNLKQYPEALKAFDKAIKLADENPSIVPLVLMKKAAIYREQKDYTAEYEALKQIVDKYPSFTQGTQTDIRKYYERAKAAAGK